MSTRAWIAICTVIVLIIVLIVTALIVVRQHHADGTRQLIGKSFSDCRSVSPICMAREATVSIESGRVALYLLDYQLASTWQAQAGTPFVAVASDDPVCRLNIEQNVEMTKEFGYTKPQIFGMSVFTKAEVTLFYVDSSGTIVDVREVVPANLWLQAKR